MKKIYTIGLFGAQVESINLGCQALTVSLLLMLEKIAQKNGIVFKYKVFERFPNPVKVRTLSQKLGIGEDRLVSTRSARFLRIFNVTDNKKCASEIRSCDLVIDLTLGDSFSDIYGVRRFISYTADKYAVEKNHVKLILGPQTYGPFEKEWVRKSARYVINRSEAVFSRDEESTHCLETLGIKKDVYTGTDLAFSLPYKPDANITGKNAGINISGMLWPHDFEEGQMESGVKMHFKCDYSALMCSVVSMLSGQGYTVHLIPHVKKDMRAIRKLHEKFPEKTICHEFTDDPVLTKNLISAMDFFVGARMHATIAAVSAGVPTIPVSYSRKFQGLFSTIGYHYGVNLRTLETQEAENYIWNALNHFDIMTEDVKKSQEAALDKSERMFLKMEEAILCAIGRPK